MISVFEQEGRKAEPLVDSEEKAKWFAKRRELKSLRWQRNAKKFYDRLKSKGKNQDDINRIIRMRSGFNNRGFRQPNCYKYPFQIEYHQM